MNSVIRKGCLSAHLAYTKCTNKIFLQLPLGLRIAGEEWGEVILRFGNEKLLTLSAFSFPL